MQSIRRAALSSAMAAARTITPKTQAASFLTQLARQSAPKVTSMLMVRAFSQSAFVANAQQDGFDKAFAPAESNGERTINETEFGLFIRNMVFDATDSHLREIFGKYGEIADASVARDARGLSRGYGFVYFTNAEALNQAIANVDGSFWQGRRLQCLPRQRKQPQTRRPQVQSHEPSSCLFIGNIPYETSDTELNRLFDGIANLADVRVAIDRTTGWPRGFAHADFADVESATAALERLKGARLGSRELRFDFAPSVRPRRTARTDADRQQQQKPEPME